MTRSRSSWSSGRIIALWTEGGFRTESILRRLLRGPQLQGRLEDLGPPGQDVMAVELEKLARDIQQRLGEPEERDSSRRSVEAESSAFEADHPAPRNGIGNRHGSPWSSWRPSRVSDLGSRPETSRAVQIHESRDAADCLVLEGRLRLDDRVDIDRLHPVGRVVNPDDGDQNIVGRDELVAGELQRARRRIRVVRFFVDRLQSIDSGVEPGSP